MISSISNNSYSAYQSFFKRTESNSALKDLMNTTISKEKTADIDGIEGLSEDENYSPLKLSTLKNKTLLDVMSEKGLTNQKLSKMQWSEKIVTENEISNEVYSRMKSSMKNDIMETSRSGFLRGERLSQEVISSLLASI